MTTIRELLDADADRWAALAALFARLGDGDWSRPGATGDWTPKDVLAHVACWHAYAVDRLEEFSERGEFSRFGDDLDAFNAKLYEENRNLSLSDAQAMSAASRHRFREEVARLAEPLPEPVARMVAANGHGHYEEHIPLLTAFLGSGA